MAFVYFLSVGLVGSLTSDFINALFNGSESISILQWEIPFSFKGLGPFLGEKILQAGGSVWAADLIQNGLIAGVASVINFLPQLIVLFYCMKTELSLLGIPLDLKTNAEIFSYIDSDGKLTGEKLQADFILYLDKDLYASYGLEKRGYRLFNQAKPIELCDDKMRTHMALAGHDRRRC